MSLWPQSLCHGANLTMDLDSYITHIIRLGYFFRPVYMPSHNIRVPFRRISRYPAHSALHTHIAIVRAGGRAAGPGAS